MGLFVWNNVAMFPYNYVYFNMPARMHATHTTYLTDLWGFSLRQAAGLATTNKPDAIILGNPLHLVTPIISAGSRSYDLSDQAKLLTGQPVSVVSYVMRTPVPKWCTSAEFIQRQLPLAPHALKLSFAAECQVS